MVRVTVGCSAACAATESPVSPVSSAQAAWGGQPHAEDERHEQRDRFLRERCWRLRSCCFHCLSSPFLFPRAFLHADARDWARAPAEDRQRRFAAGSDPTGLLCYAIKPRRGRVRGETPLAHARFLAGVLAGRQLRCRVTVAAPCGICTRLPLLRTSSSCVRRYNARSFGTR